MERKKLPEIKSLWCMIVLLLEDRQNGLTRDEILGYLSGGESPSRIPLSLRGVYGDFGYRFTLSRSLDEVIRVLVEKGWARKVPGGRYSLTREGGSSLRKTLTRRVRNPLYIAAYGETDMDELLRLTDLLLG